MPRAIPRPRKLRRSKLREADDETNNQIGYWSRERIERMDAAFVEAMQRAMRARKKSGDAHATPAKRKGKDGKKAGGTHVPPAKRKGKDGKARHNQLGTCPQLETCCQLPSAPAEAAE